MVSDYVDPRLRKALDKAVNILVSHASEWRNDVDAYWLLVKYEDEIGIPVIYDFVREAVEKARAIMAQKPVTAKAVEVEG